MKRIIMIVAIPLLVVLITWFGAKSQTHKVPKTFPNLVPEVSRFGTLINLKDEKGRSIFSEPIQEGFYVRFRVGNSKEQVLDVIGDSISDPNVDRCVVNEAISVTGITTQNGLNVSSGFIFDKSKGTLRVIRTIVNLSKDTMYLSEVKNHADTKLLSKEKAKMYLSAVKNDADTKLPASRNGSITCRYCSSQTARFYGKIRFVQQSPMLLSKEKATMYLSAVENHADTELPASPTGTGTVYATGPACWPCMPLPCKESSTTSQEPTETGVKQLLTFRRGLPLAGNSTEPTETGVKQLLTLPARSAIVLTTEHKIIWSKGVARP